MRQTSVSLVSGGDGSGTEICLRTGGPGNMRICIFLGPFDIHGLTANENK